MGGCRSGDDVEAFCTRLGETHRGGPVFTNDPDGGLSADPGALVRLEELAALAPEAIAEDMAVLAEEAAALVRMAQLPPEDRSSSGGDGRLSRSVVDEAQRAVLRYAATTCDIDLTRAPSPGAEGDVDAPPDVLPTD